MYQRYSDGEDGRTSRVVTPRFGFTDWESIPESSTVDRFVFSYSDRVCNYSNIRRRCNGLFRLLLLLLHCRQIMSWDTSDVIYVFIRKWLVMTGRCPFQSHSPKSSSALLAAEEIRILAPNLNQYFNRSIMGFCGLVGIRPETKYTSSPMCYYPETRLHLCRGMPREE